MKKRQILLKKLEKQNISGQKILKAIERSFPQQGIQEILDNFLHKRNHEQSLQDVDPQLLQIVFTDLMENQSSEDMEVDEKIKTDVLTQSAEQLLAFCREKDLIRLHQYRQTIKNKSHREHSFYGYMLVNSFPDEFYIGKKCTHYHCRTTAHKIQQQYGIFNNPLEASQEEEVHSQAEEPFIVNSDEEEESQEEEERVRGKARNKRSRRKQDRDCDSQDQQPKIVDKRKDKMKDLLNSQSQQENIQKNNSSNKKKPSRMQLLNQQHSQQQPNNLQDKLINEALTSLQISEIISNIKYSDIFEYLSENYREKLSPLTDVMSQIVLINHKKEKRQRSNKKNKSHRKRLAKSKINLKELSLEDLIAECIKKNIVQEQDISEQTRNSIQEHPILAYQLLQLEPQNYIIEGDFNAYPQGEINTQFQSAYKQYESQLEKEGQEQNQLDDQDEEQQQYSEGQGQDDQSNYSVDSGQDNLGVL